MGISNGMSKPCTLDFEAETSIIEFGDAVYDRSAYTFVAMPGIIKALVLTGGQD